MANRPIGEVVRCLRRAALLPAGGGATDGQLLEHFLARHEEAAFEALVRRHGPMVLGVCRRVLHNCHDAEDAFQATFLVLVRKAASILPRERVGNWLYGVAYRIALKARTARARRHRHERRARETPGRNAPPDAAGRDLCPLLDWELERLPDRYRATVVLCDLQGMTKREAARRLGIPEGTLSSRLARGRAMLRARLARRGVTLSLGSLAALLSQQAAPAGVPAPLVVSTVRAAVPLAVGQARGAISANVAALTEGMVRTMGMSKLKATVAVLVVASVVGLGVAVGAYRTTAAAQAVAEQQADAGKKAPPAPVRSRGPAPNEMPLPSPIALTVVLVSLDDQGWLVVRERITRADGTDGLTTARYDRAGAQVYEAGRGVVRPKDLPRLLKQETLAFVADAEQTVDPAYLRLLKEGTLIFLLPEPEPEAPQPPPRHAPLPPAPTPQRSGQAGETKDQEDALETLLARLRQDHRLRHSTLNYEIDLKRVQGRTLIEPVFKRKDTKTGQYDIVAEAREAELRVDLKSGALLIHMRHGKVTGEGGSAFFEDRIWAVPLPKEIIEIRPHEADASTMDRRSFEVPFRIDPDKRRRVREVVLYMSTDRGRTWRAIATSPPDRESFPFQAPADGLYWFAIGIIDHEGRRDPTDISQAPPGLRVWVQTDSKEPAAEGAEKQAEKDFRIAEFYQRTGQPTSASFYYEVVRRRYPGTTFASKAAERLKELNKDRKQAPAAPEPPPARVGQIFLVGNEKTPINVILKEVPLYPGQALNSSDLQTAERNLERLNLFREPPRVTVIDPDAPGAFKDILIQVKEK